MAGCSETIETLIWATEPYSPFSLDVIELKGSLCSSHGRNWVARLPFEQYMIGNMRRVKCHKKRPRRFNVLAKIKEEEGFSVTHHHSMWCKR
jgi:hypothetical protein